MSSKKTITIERFAYTPQGTFGQLKVGDFECYTVERPWLHNKRNVSCIPEGWYELYYSRYNRGGYDAYEIKHCTGRSEILIHIGNISDNVEGCIAVGQRLGSLAKQWAVINSSKAFKYFMKEMDGVKDATLKITSYQAR